MGVTKYKGGGRLDKKLIEEINELAKKQREQGLTSKEAARQQILRQEYLKQFRKNFKAVLNQVEIVD